MASARSAQLMRFASAIGGGALPPSSAARIIHLQRVRTPMPIAASSIAKWSAARPLATSAVHSFAAGNTSHPARCILLPTLIESRRSFASSSRMLAPEKPVDNSASTTRPADVSTQPLSASKATPSDAATAAAAAAPSGTTLPANAPAWVRMLNDSMARYPAETVAAYIGLDIVSMVGMYQLLTALAVEIPADFAMAFAISRLLRRFKLPLDIAAAGVLSKIYPALTMVQPSKAIAAVSGASTAPDGTAPASLPPVAGDAAAAAPQPPKSFFRRAASALAIVIDRYGLAFLVSQRMVVGLASVGSIFVLIRSGVDVQGWLALHGGDIFGSSSLAVGAAGKVAGTWAAAATLGAIFFPAVVLGSGWIGRVVGQMRAAKAVAR